MNEMMETISMRTMFVEDDSFDWKKNPCTQHCVHTAN